MESIKLALLTMSPNPSNSSGGLASPKSPLISLNDQKLEQANKDQMRVGGAANNESKNVTAS